MTDVLSKYYENAFITAGEGGSIYIPMSVLERAGHDRKGCLLSELELPDLSGLTVVDYGVGSWGFGCVFPKLKGCKVAIGVDISQYAIDCSRKISENDPALSGAELQFITSSGYNIKLEPELWWNLHQEIGYATDDACRVKQKQQDPEALEERSYTTSTYPTTGAVFTQVQKLDKVITEFIKELKE